MKEVNKLSAATSIVFYAIGALCLIMMVRVGMAAVSMVNAAMSTPDILFTNKVMYANIAGLGVIIVLMFLSGHAFKEFFNLGLYYWHLAFNKEVE